jgi:hypothetical protein
LLGGQDAVFDQPADVEAGKTIVRSFVEAAVTAVLAIAVLLWTALRRIVDVLLTLVPLLLAATVTLELCSAFNIPLNFCQHHRAAGVARRRRGVQDLLHHGLAQRPDGARTINLDPGCNVQRDDHGHRIWELMVIQ